MLYTIVRLLYALCDLYTIIICVYVLMTWIPRRPGGVIYDIFNVLGKICDPYLNLFRRLIPPLGGTLDFSPVVAVIVLQLVVQLLVRILV